jgi:hypothetical protein
LGAVHAKDGKERLKVLSLIAIGAGVFGVYAGWHWKMLHRSFQDVSRYRRGLRAAKKAQWEHVQRALLFAVLALVILVVLASMH